MTKDSKETKRVFFATKNGYEIFEDEDAEVLLIAYYALKTNRLHMLQEVLEKEGLLKNTKQNKDI